MDIPQELVQNKLLRPADELEHEILNNLLNQKGHAFLRYRMNGGITVVPLLLIRGVNETADGLLLLAPSTNNDTTRRVDNYLTCAAAAGQLVPFVVTVSGAFLCGQVLQDCSFSRWSMASRPRGPWMMASGS